MSRLTEFLSHKFPVAERGPSTVAEVRSQSTALALTFGDPTALATLRKALTDEKAEMASRQKALDSLVRP